MACTTQHLSAPDGNERGGSPSLEDFTSFHSMVCHPLVAKRCIQYFDGGALFASMDDYEQHDLSAFDYTKTPIRLNLFSYYTLVIFSATGFLTWTGRTQIHLAREEDSAIQVRTSPNQKMPSGLKNHDAPAVKSLSIVNPSGQKELFIPYKVIDYIQNRSKILQEGTDQTKKDLKVRLRRRFEFTFGSLLVVMMCHLECGDQRYLVEVYDFLHKENTWTRTISSTMTLARDLLLGVFSTIRRRSAKEEKQC